MDKIKFKILKDVFGHNDFRELQEEGIDSILNNKDLLMILPTGGGKSLVYQLPTLVKNGITIVISPLIALMQDQVSSLKAQNISADMISSAQKKTEITEIFRRIHNHELKFLYLSPERLNSEYMFELFKSLDINFFVVDEAHCISGWGHEFRSDYRLLDKIKRNFPDIAVCAFTATSTGKVSSDIVNSLGLDNPTILKGSVFRKNIFISAERRIKNGYPQVESFLKRHNDESGIIYVSSRKKADALSEHLNKKNYKSLSYHAGLSSKVRERNFKQFTNDKINIIVATIAFGMGIDKSDIRFVIHLSLPKTTEGYYQEIGRSGRDGEDSEALLLFNAGDMIQHNKFLEDEYIEEDYKKHMKMKIDGIYKYATSEICFHLQLAKYFNESINPCNDRCDNCIQKDDEREDITTPAQMILSTIYKTGQFFGKNYIVDILRGSKEQKLLSNGADKLSVYNIGNDLSKKEWFIIIERLLEIAILKVGDYHSLKLTNDAILVLKNKKKIDIKASRRVVEVAEKKVKQVEEIEYEEELFQLLREKRAYLAKELKLPAYIVFGDKTLKHLANEKPHDKESMLEVNGVGEKKYEQFGEDFLSVIREYGS